MRTTRLRGARTRDHINEILTRITLVGAFYLIIISFIPEWMITGIHLNHLPGALGAVLEASAAEAGPAAVKPAMTASRVEATAKNGPIGRRTLKRRIMPPMSTSSTIAEAMPQSTASCPSAPACDHKVS